MLTVNANLFRIANLFASTEESRYYLCGVLIEPVAEGGVRLVATDGHKLVCIYERDGKADKPTLISLKGDALKACKSRDRNRVLELGNDGVALVREWSDSPEEKGKIVGYQPEAVIDGSFPDYRVAVSPKANYVRNASPTFSSFVLSTIAEAGGEIALHYHGFRFKKEGGSSMRADSIAVLVREKDPLSSPAIVVWPSSPNIVAVIVPTTSKALAVAVPDWFKL